MRTLAFVCSILVALGAIGCGDATLPPVDARPDVVATFSIVARDPETGDLGVAVQSRFFGVGAVVPWARADVGAVATQAWANTTYGPRGLELLDDGAAAETVVKALLDQDAGRARRQLGIVDARGRAFAFTGDGCNDWAGHVVGDGFCCQGNILAGQAVVQAMAATFRETPGALPERLVAALAAGQAKGGDKRGRQSAALLVVRRGGGYAALNDRYVDIHVEDHTRPIEELARLLGLHRQVFPDRAALRTPDDLAREARDADNARGAFERSSERPALAQYVGTQHGTEDDAVVHFWIPGRPALVGMRVARRDGVPQWRVIDDPTPGRAGRR